MTVKLPKPFGNLIEKYKHMFDSAMNDCHVLEGYVDNGYPRTNGLQSLKGLLSLSENDTCCDLYCTVAFGGKKVHMLWEDKGQQGKGTHYNDGIKQLKSIYPKVKALGRPIDHVILSNIKGVSGVINLVHSKEHGCKVIKGPKDQIIKCYDKDIRVLEG